jgi:hypothetical protein
MRLEISIEKLNNYIDRLQADASPRTLDMGGDGEGSQAASIEIAMLQMAAHLNSMRPRAGVPDPGFLSNLRSRVLAETAGGTNLAR